MANRIVRSTRKIRNIEKHPMNTSEENDLLSDVNGIVYVRTINGFERVTDQTDDVENDVKKLQDDLKKLKSDNTKLKTDVQTLQDNYNDLQANYDDLQERITALESDGNNEEDTGEEV